MGFTGIAYSFLVRSNFKNIEVRKIFYSGRTPTMTKGDEERGGDLKSVTEGKTVI